MWKKNWEKNCQTASTKNSLTGSDIRRSKENYILQYFYFLSGKIKPLPAKALNYIESNIIKKKKEDLFFIQEIISKFMVISGKQLC
jgi:hypothetical protein